MWFEPENEQGVVFLFGYLCTGHESNIKIEYIRTAFPDAVMVIDGVKARVEFEYMASNFILHGHDIRECDLVVCWENDAPEDFPLPIIALCESLAIIDHHINYADPRDKELWYWKNRAKQAERESSRLRAELGAMGIEKTSTTLDELALRVYETYTAHPEFTKTALAEAVGVSRPTVNNRLQLLEAAGKFNGNGHS